MQAFRELVKKLLPQRLVDRLRRRRIVRRYLREMGDELLERHSRLETLEEEIATRPGGFYERMAREVLDRTDLVLQRLDQRLEGQGARHDERLRALEEEVAALRAAVEQARAALQPRIGRPTE